MAAPAGIRTYFSLCGVEIWNQARLHAYMAAGVTPAGTKLLTSGCDALPDVIPCAAHRPPDLGGYRTPELDFAPWYDPTVPESRNFAGVLAIDVNMSGPVRRRMVQSVGHGARFGRTRFPGRTLEVKAALIGKTCCGVEYGLRWLTQALLGSFCDCQTCDAHFLTCCPVSSGEDDCLVVEGETYVRTSVDSELTRAADLVRNMHGVGLLEGPEVTKCRTMGCVCSCAPLTEVEFTLGVGVPWMFAEPRVVVEDMELGSCAPNVCTVTWSKDEDCDEVGRCEPVGVAGSCPEDPLHPPPPAPPRAWPPNYGGVCVTMTSERTCFTLNEENEREWGDKALIVELAAGDAPLRSLTIRFYRNPARVDCCDFPTFDDPCLACDSIFVKHVPAGGVLRIDGERREITLTCFGGHASSDGSSEVYSADGRTFQWPDLDCSPHCVVIDKDCFHLADDATISMWLVPREL